MAELALTDILRRVERATGPARFSGQAIEASEVEAVDWRVVEALGDEDLAWQKAIRLGFQWLAERKVERERDLLMLSARELYEQLATASPAWVVRIPQKDLAAYLGVTPVGLNRIIRRALRPSAASARRTTGPGSGRPG